LQDNEPVDEGSIHGSDVDPAEFEDNFNLADDDTGDDVDDVDDEDVDAKSHISIASSRDEARTKERAYGDFDGERPWKVQGFDNKTRFTWELMYCNLATRVGDWEFAEDIQREKVCLSNCFPYYQHSLLIMSAAGCRDAALSAGFSTRSMGYCKSRCGRRLLPYA